jgi:hypothetical protein
MSTNIVSLNKHFGKKRFQTRRTPSAKTLVPIAAATSTMKILLSTIELSFQNNSRQHFDKRHFLKQQYFFKLIFLPRDAGHFGYRKSSTFAP